MADDKEKDSKDGSLSKSWSGGEAADYGDHVFKPEELDIYTNKITLETYIFHSKKLNYPNIGYLEYNPETYAVTVHYKDGRALDLGVKIQWLVRPYFVKAKEIWIVRTRDGNSIDGITVPLIHTGAEPPKAGK
jgi:hypothetical protein